MLLFIGGGIFIFLGILVGWNIVKEFGGILVFGVIVGILIFNLVMVNVKLFGEVLVFGWGGLFVVIFVVWFMVVVER